MITRIAGNGAYGNGGVGGPATSASLNTPEGICLDQAGNLFIVEFLNYRVARVDAATGILTVAAGNGQRGYGGDGGPATQAMLQYPTGCAVDPAGNLFISDQYNHRVRRVDAASGIITTAAGTGLPEFSGDGGPAVSAGLNTPSGLAFDATGNLYIADSSNHRVRRVDAASGIITTVAGTGMNEPFAGDGGPAVLANLYRPAGLAVDAANNLYIGDMGHCRIRRVDALTGIIQTVAGNGGLEFSGDGAPATSVGIGRPAYLALDSSGRLFFAGGLSGRVQQIALATGAMVTVAGIGKTFRTRGDGGPATSAEMAFPIGVAVTPDGDLLVSENPGTAVGMPGGPAPLSNEGQCVRRIFLPPPTPYTTTTVASSNSAIGAGEPVTFTATVTPIGAAGTATGSVQFFNDYNYYGYGERPLLGTAALVNGTASWTTSALPTGTCAISAVYSGDATFSSSASAYLTQTVLAPSSVTLASSRNPSDPNQSVTLTATVSPAGGGGTVVFRDGAATLGTAAVSWNTATLAVAFTASGEHSLTAVYSGGGSVAGGTSPVFTQRVLTASTTTVASTPNPSTYGAEVTITASVSPAAATGTVDFRIGGASIGSATLVGGQASITYAGMGVGNRTITAVYSGDGNHAGSTSQPLAHVVTKAATTISLASAPNPSTYPEAVTITATVSPSAATGTVDFSADGVFLQSATLSSGQASITTTSLAGGNRAITAVYGGDANYETSSSQPLSHVVSKATTTVSADAWPNPSTSGESVTIVANVSPAAATGTVEFRVDGVAVGTATLFGVQANITYAGMTAGNHTITAVYSGNAYYEGSSSQPLGHLVKSATTTSVAAAPNPSIQGGAVTLTAAVSPAAATGSIEFRVDGVPVWSAVLSGGQASAAYSVMSPGNHTITAAYLGDVNHVGSTSPPLAHLVKAATTTSIGSNIQPATFGQTVQFLAYVSPSSAAGSVQFLDGAAVLGTAPLGGGLAILSVPMLAAGEHAITAVYSGNTSYAGSTSQVLPQGVVKASPSATVSSGPNPSVWGQAVMLTGWASMASATGTIQFKDGAAILGTAPIVNGNATLAVSNLAVGTHSITAVYSGDANHNPVTSPAVIQTVNKAPAAVTVVSNRNPATRRQLITFTATVAPTAATGTVTFLDGTTSLGTVTLSNGTASITRTLGIGTHSITARYNGNADYAVSTSPPLIQVVTK